MELIRLRAGHATYFVHAKMTDASIVLKFPEMVSRKMIKHLKDKIIEQFKERFALFNKQLHVWKEEGCFLCIEAREIGGGNHLAMLERQARWRLDNPRMTRAANQRRAYMGTLSLID